MKTEMISTRIDQSIKIEFIEVCDEIGLSPSQAIKLFAKAVINYGGIPFELKVRSASKVTLAAIKELEDGDGINVKNTDSLFKELGVKAVDVQH